MKTIKPTKGISQKLVIFGMYENYFLYIAFSAFGCAIFFFYLLGELASSEEDSLRFPAFLLIVVTMLVVLGVMYFLFTHLTKQGETKQYPQGHIRVSNKDF